MPSTKEDDKMARADVEIRPAGTVLADDLRLEALGYDPELKRAFSAWETFGVAFSIMGVVPSIAATLIYCLPYGGPVSMIWGWLMSSCLILTIGVAMSELASSMPTSGGLYFWTHRLSSPKYRDFLAWMVGYNSFLGNVAAVSSLAWGGSNIFLAAASISDPSFTASAAIQFGVFAAILLGCTLLCAYGTTLFARLQTPSVMLNVLLLLVTIIGLPIARRKELNTAAFTFGGWANLTGWPNVYAFIMSFLAPVWTICSFDCAVSLSEEATNAATAVPQAIMGSIASAGVTGTIFLLICALTMGPDVAAVNDSEIGQPLAFIFQQAFGNKGSLAIWSFMCIAEFFMTASLLLPASRQAFAFARDGALPYSKFFYHINSKTGTPVRTVWLVSGAALPLGLLGFADPENQSAINAIFTLAIIGPYCAYAIPIAARLFGGEHNFTPGPFHLGRFSRPIAWVSIIWMAFACVVFCFPADVAPDATTMNYAIVVAAGVWAFAIGYWFFPKIGGRTFFHGPVTHEATVVRMEEDTAIHALDEMPASGVEEVKIKQSSTQSSTD